MIIVNIFGGVTLLQRTEKGGKRRFRLVSETSERGSEA